MRPEIIRQKLNMDKRKLIAALENGLAGENGQLIGMTQKQIATVLSKELGADISPRTVRHYVAHLNHSRNEEERLQSRKRGRPLNAKEKNSPGVPLQRHVFTLDHLLALELLHISARSVRHIYKQLHGLDLIQGSKNSFYEKIQSWLPTHACSTTYSSTPNKRDDQHPILSRYSLRVSATVLEITPDYLYQVYLIGCETHTGYLQISSVEAINPEAQPDRRSSGRPKKLPTSNDRIYRQTNGKEQPVMHLSRSVLIDCIQNFTHTIGLPINDITLIDSPTIHLSSTMDVGHLDMQPFNLVSILLKRSPLEKY